MPRPCNNFMFRLLLNLPIVWQYTTISWCLCTNILAHFDDTRSSVLRSFRKNMEDEKLVRDVCVETEGDGRRKTHWDYSTTLRPFHRKRHNNLVSVSKQHMVSVTNVLRGMYSERFNGGASSRDASTQDRTTQGTTPPVTPLHHRPWVLTPLQS